jgi:hypothetical protein
MEEGEKRESEERGKVRGKFRVLDWHDTRKHSNFRV